MEVNNKYDPLKTPWKWTSKPFNAGIAGKILSRLRRPPRIGVSIDRLSELSACSVCALIHMMTPTVLHFTVKVTGRSITASWVRSMLCRQTNQNPPQPIDWSRISISTWNGDADGVVDFWYSIDLEFFRTNRQRCEIPVTTRSNHAAKS